MDREDKILETSVDALALRCQDLKNSIASFIFKLETEYENLNWPSLLDNYALISGQINNMMKVIKSDKTPAFRNRILLPLMLAPDRDEELVQLTEGRVQAFNHDMCPDYLRTKPDPEVEIKESQLHLKSSQISPDNAIKQITSANKIVNQILELIKSARDNWETESLQRANASNQTSSNSDTHAIIAAISSGKGIIDIIASPKPVVNSASIINQIPPNRPGNKAPSAIKTNIKSASSMNPYSR